jgi:hypothetical protein
VTVRGADRSMPIPGRREAALSFAAALFAPAEIVRLEIEQRWADNRDLTGCETRHAGNH